MTGYFYIEIGVYVRYTCVNIKDHRYNNFSKIFHFNSNYNRMGVYKLYISYNLIIIRYKT